MARGVAKIKEEEVKPTHFDIDVLKKCLKRFCASGGDVRSELRKLLLRDLNRTMKVFLDEHGEQSFKKCVDVFELSARLKDKEKGLDMDLDPVIFENLGSILMCFGEIEHEMKYGDRIPDDGDEERRKLAQRKNAIDAREVARKEADAKGE